MHEEPIPVPLRDRTGATIGYAVLDQADAHLAEHRWYLDSDPSRNHGKPYARRNGTIDGRRVGIFLHREVLGLKPGDPRQGDHVNGLTLDCRRSNLRVATGAQNQQNRHYYRSDKTSRYRNVTWDKARQKWLAQACVGGKTHHIGRFDIEEAANAAAVAWRAEHMPFSEDARRAA